MNKLKEQINQLLSTLLQRIKALPQRTKYLGGAAILILIVLLILILAISCSSKHRQEKPLDNPQPEISAPAQPQILPDDIVEPEPIQLPEGYFQEPEELGVIDAPELPEQNGQSARRIMYCGSLNDVNLAAQFKAQLALLGLGSKIARLEGTYTLLLGPFDNREQALERFKRIDEAKLFNSCTLYEY